MGNGYILALDQSTSGSKAMVVNAEGRILARAAVGHKQYYPQPGWVEHDPVEIYENAKAILAEALTKAKLKPAAIDALAITNQRETVVVWDRETGLPVYNAIVWQCRRTGEICTRLKQQGWEGMVKDRTGLLLDPYFSATKVQWILENVAGAAARAQAGKLLMGTMDSWLIWKLTKGRVHATDYTNASRTLLFNIKSLQWDNDLLKIFNIPATMLAKVQASNTGFGYTAVNELFAGEIPIAGVIGDSQGALFGQTCFEPGMVKATYGTGSSVLMNIGSQYREGAGGLVTSIAWGIDGRVEYVLEGIVHATGDTLKWVKENLGLFQHWDELPAMAESIGHNEDVYFVPAFAGLGIPYWDTDARAGIVGISRRSRKEHIVRSALEAIAYQIKDAVDTMEAGSGIRPRELRVDGGGTRNSFLMQFQADMLQINVVSTEFAELSAMGAAYLAGLAAGVWHDKTEIRKLRLEGRTYVPSMEEAVRNQYFQGWKQAVGRILTR
ncbi:glycerol kinase [Lucifera butyrica]|uniref:ATP:glycerol 3-phosphotransferase n=1 Tax=Lucifera butyrica TaxID=1351585 RepID=A0A498RFF9_9FIRM|nr:glycerol kinase GlpK [Lucifera butyrica]VBB09687.1 glycerol kinase [Lucifera butyrica]